MSLQRKLWSVISIALLAGATAACGTKTSSTFGLGGGDGGSGGAGSFLLPDASVGDGSTTNGALTVNQSSPQTVTFVIGQPAPTIDFTATYNGQAVQPSWTVDQGALATISNTGVFSPTGASAGTVHVGASYSGSTIALTVNIMITGSQNGPLAGQSLPEAGAGGYGGVGGEGVGLGVDGGVLTALNGTPTGTAASQNLTLLYPYNGTVWPQGLLAPLLQWSSNLTDVTGIKIQLQSGSGNFTWTGTFGIPAPVLADGGVGQFIRHPILQDIWSAATNSAGGSTLTMSLTVANGTGASATAYGPVTSTWTIAPALLTGTIYYNSYGTNLVQNSVGFAKVFGAATLAIASGAASPTVAAGYTSTTTAAGCRGCHVVAGGGSQLIVEHGDSYGTTSYYTLTSSSYAADAGTTMYGSSGTFAWAGLSYDGSLALTNAMPMSAQAQATQLYKFPPASNSVAPTPLVTNLPVNLKGGLPVFSSDTSHVAFTYLKSLDGGSISGLSCTNDCLVSMAFDSTTNTFSSPSVLTDVANRVGFASFMPTNDSVVFHQQIAPSSTTYLATESGGTAQIYWSDLATGTATRLNNLNGLNSSGSSYLPANTEYNTYSQSSNDHPDGGDILLNYEPTVNPVASGGYAWVIFASRRLYGNVAVQNPWLSDPDANNYDFQSPNQITTKKLWVAAISLNAPAGSDPSFPAFYLPGQEIQAGNSRGYWVLSPCLDNGATCSTGSACCSGYCLQNSSNTGLICSNQPTGSSCTQIGNLCSSTADCCSSSSSSTQCIGGYCSLLVPR